jgi:hypothetical protein
MVDLNMADLNMADLDMAGAVIIRPTSARWLSAISARPLAGPARFVQRLREHAANAIFQALDPSTALSQHNPAGKFTG